MPNPVVTNLDYGALCLDTPRVRDELVTFTGAATYAAGTILARDTGTLKLIAYVKGGVTNGNGVPKAILLETLVATGAGDLKTRAAIKGLFNKRLLIIQADGGPTNIDATVEDLLRAMDLGVEPLTQMSGT